MRSKKFAICAIFIYISIGVFLSLSGCVNTSTVPPVASGRVFLDGNVVSGAAIEAVPIDGTGNLYTITDDTGAYTLDLTPAIPYNVTATYQGLRHTIWPVYLDNKSDTFNITLTTIPKSTVEGTGYATSAHPEHHNLTASNFAINLNSTKDHTVISKLFNKDGSYSVEVEPNVTYEVNGTLGEMGSPPITQFFYHNYKPLGNRPQITVSSNETVLIDYMVALP
ncbi:carboxypeptidase-like regulatory domain-containing protein [Methanocella conradii]|uniref:carboxypeptidase-like regulatory domain-containing protein n=1 Tax=Methanocella conradii TaxID=1175444 RepID=UPI0024B33CEB|nr:carboxypeptidase-like regulatory domain-containing protein [Methanocella conradii]MDI6896942.1 carboxypeptidase-like regulatory domain-containing protein [Methanocella conradii]